MHCLVSTCSLPLKSQSWSFASRKPLNIELSVHCAPGASILFKPLYGYVSTLTLCLILIAYLLARFNPTVGEAIED